MIGRSLRNRIRLTLSYVTLILLSVCSLYPALWIILGSFRPGKSLYSKTLFPESYTLDNYKALFTSKSFLFGPWYMNTLKIAVISMILGTLLALLCGYAVSRYRFKMRKTALSTILVLNMFPGFLSLIAIFILLKEMNLLNTHMAVILVYAAGAPLLSTLLVKGFFDAVPRSLDEAARIDGASNLTIFARIMLPLSKPLITYVALTTFVGPWVDYIFAALVLRSRDKWTLAVGLFDQVARSNQSTNFTLFAAASVLIALPITILFIFLQRFLVEGLTAGASKG
ncbi:arabinogalactan oligomer / maltooligosaccharide transport system permease protein [Paenibacillus sp. UNCCL117]|uniref:sugar ABC transporter permease n=1 Tax=unclassified Paenibacillus TaxID=185978 RepID=UPI00088F25F7|nr:MULTISPECIES: sugar ABC transporter permease [unclassified Paenibacillus]SDD05434.1 carbohydrate ABC transporter membrane protein 2, CUT1 family [Paenibacillus sp. cl123]SFW31893.1 arabinogalactan oligomer / maltooligosaccharide transport system permease protein [Paenibacillus sp. UNCCL117]